MKPRLRLAARELRSVDGWSMRRIAKKLDAPLSSVRSWVLDVPLTSEQRARLRERANDGRKLGIETVKKSRAVRWEQFRREADEEYARWSQSPMFMFGLALYAGEGSKTGHSPAMTNSNPGIVKHGVEFFRLCGVDKRDMRVMVTLYDDMDADAAVRYWSQFLDIPRNQFYRTTVLKTRVVHRRCNKLEYGICRVGFCSIAVMQKILRWIELALGTSERKLK